MELVPKPFKRLVLTIALALISAAAGFYLATGFETPHRAEAVDPGNILSASGGGRIPLVTAEGTSPFVAVAQRVQPTVVNIAAEKALSGHPAVPFDLFDWGPFFNRPPDDSRRRVPYVTSGGSGIIISSSGYILTNNHVISDASKITVSFADKHDMPAEVVGVDPETDVALIKVNENIPDNMVAKLGDSDSIQIGDWAIAVGNPFGLDWTVTVGVISARDRSNLNIGGGEGPSYQNFIQTDASINFGNSGGPLVNIKGEVIGVNTAINARGQGIGFAIPINLAKKVADQLMAHGEVRRGYLGVVPAELDDLKREALGLEPTFRGVFIDGVQKGTPAEESGLEAGDIIIAIEGKPVSDVTEFRFRIADFPPDSRVPMTILKRGESSPKQITIKLADRSQFANLASSATIRRPNEWMGIRVAAVDERSIEAFDLKVKRGVVVVDIVPDSPAEGFIEQGDVIVEIAGREINSVDDFNRVAKELSDRKKAIPIWVMRGERRAFVPIRPE